MARDKLTCEEAEKTLTMQFPIDFKREKAQIVIDNSQDLEHTRRQVIELWEEGLLK